MSKRLLLINLITCLLFLSCQEVSIISSPFPSFDGIKIAFTDEGKGKPVFLLHGFINTRKNWDKAALKKDFAEVKDIMALADYLELEAYEVVGYSRGSIVLAQLLTKDKRIKKAVIGGMGAAFTDPNWPIPTIFAKAFGGEAPLDDMTRGAVEYATSINADLKVLSLLQYHQPATPISELEKIKTKILVLRGDKDDSNGSATELQKHLTNSRLQIVAGDHNNTYKSQVFSDAILDFLKE